MTLQAQAAAEQHNSRNVYRVTMQLTGHKRRSTLIRPKEGHLLTTADEQTK